MSHSNYTEVPLFDSVFKLFNQQLFGWIIRHLESVKATKINWFNTLTMCEKLGNVKSSLLILF